MHHAVLLNPLVCLAASCEKSARVHLAVNTRRPYPDPAHCLGYQDADELYDSSWYGRGRMNFTDRGGRNKKTLQSVLSVEKKAHNEK